MQRVGVLRFERDEMEHSLSVYKDLTMARMKGESKNLFLPFTDLSNGEESYGGGRYLDLSSDEIFGDSLELDFNRAYNPWCVYSDSYSCPIPPDDNHLKIRVEAGAKMPGKL